MSTIRFNPAAPAAAGDPREAGLRRAAQQLEAVFVEQLYKAMRETVPEGGLVDGGAGEEMFSGMLDQHLAGLTPEKMDSGLSHAIYRQLRQRLATAQAGSESSKVGGEA